MNGPKLHSMAWRNLWRNRRRTLITVFGISFGLLLAILFTGMGDSSYRSMIDYAARMGGGHVAVQHPDYLELPSVKKTVTDAPSIAARAKKDPRVESTVTRITGAVMLATAANSQGASMMAIDPAVETVETLEILESIAEGDYFERDDEKGIIVGAKLAENLELELGKKVVYTMTDKSGEIVSGLARVKGIVRSGAPSLDAGLCILPIGTVRETLGYADGEATQVAVFLADHRDSAAVAADLGAVLGPQVAARTWKETQPDLDGLISMKESSGIIFEYIMLLLIGAGIFNTLFVSVMERLREFGIMVAIGFSQLQVFSLVMWESFWLAVVGLVAGAIVTAGPYHHLNTVGVDVSAMMGEGNMEVAGVAADPTLYVEILPEKLITIVVVVIFATLLSGLYPAWKAGRVEPADAVKLV